MLPLPPALGSMRSLQRPVHRLFVWLVPTQSASVDCSALQYRLVPPEHRAAPDRSSPPSSSVPRARHSPPLYPESKRSLRTAPNPDFHLQGLPQPATPTETLAPTNHSVSPRQ